MLRNQIDDYVITGQEVDGLFLAQARPSQTLFAAPATIPADVWHRRYGHLNYRSLSKVSPSSSKKIDCEPCSLSKAHRLPFSSHFPKSDLPLFRIHSDVIGPMPTASLGGGKYVVSFIDDATRHTCIKIMRTKSEVFTHFVHFQNESERYQNKKIAILKSDRGGEYTSNQFTQYLSQQGITFERAPAETPEQNSVAERYGRSLMERTRSVMLDASIPNFLWGEIIMSISFILNISPNASIDMETPQELWNSGISGAHKINNDFLRAIGCAAYPLLKTTEYNKLSARSRLCVHVGYEKGARAY
jgi:hypothetical protein